MNNEKKVRYLGWLLMLLVYLSIYISYSVFYESLGLRADMIIFLCPTGVFLFGFIISRFLPSRSEMDLPTYYMFMDPLAEIESLSILVAVLYLYYLYPIFLLVTLLMIISLVLMCYIFALSLSKTIPVDINAFLREMMQTAMKKQEPQEPEEEKEEDPK